MSRILKYISIIAVLMVLLPLAATLFLNTGNTKSIISSYIEGKTGRTFSIDGRLNMTMSLSPVIHAEQVRLSNSEWAQSPDMLSMEKLSISLSVAGLLRGEGLINSIHMENPRLWIERNSQTAKYNLDLRKETNRSGSRSIFWKYLDIRQVSIKKGQVIYFHDYRNWKFDIADAVAESLSVDHPINLRLSAELENTPLVLAGQIGSLESIIRRAESAVNLQGHIVGPENPLTISGVIGDIISWHGLNLWFEAFTTDLSELSGLAGTDLPPYRDITASWELIQPESVGSLRMESIKITSSAHGLESSIHGQVGRLAKFNQVDLIFSAEGDLDQQVISQKWQHDIALNTDVSGHITGNRDDLYLTLTSGIIQSDGMKLNLAGPISDLVHDWTSPLRVSFQLDNLSYLGSMANTDFPSIPNVVLSADIYRIDSKIHIRDIHLSNDASEVRVLGTGSVENPGEQQRGSIDFSVQAEAGFINQFFGPDVDLPLDNMTITGVAHIAGNDVSIPDIIVSAMGEGIQIDGKGAFASVKNPETLQVDLEATLQGLDKLSGLAGQSLPSTEAMIVTGKLHGDNQGNLSFGSIRLNLEDPSVSANLSGEIRNSGKSPMLDMDFDFQFDSPDWILQHYPDLPMKQLVTRLLPARAKGRIRSVKMENGKINNRLESFEILSHADIQAKLTGQMDHLFTSQLAGHALLTISGEFDGASLQFDDSDQIFSSAMGADLNGSMGIRVSSQGIVIDDIDVTMISGDSSANVSGKIESVSPFESTGLELIMSIPNPGSLFSLADSDLATDTPLHGKLVFTNANQSRQISVDLNMADSDLTGSIHLPLEKQGDRIVGKFVSQNMDLTRLLKKSEDSPNLFSRKPMQLSWLNDLNMEIQADFRRFRNKALLLDNVASNTVVHNGLLSSTITGKSEGRENSSATLELLLSKQPQGGFKSQITINGDDIDLSSLTGSGDIDPNQRGTFSIGVDLQGSGRSVSEILGRANGSIMFRLEDATVRNQGLKLLGGDLFLGLLTAINPFTTQDEMMEIECGVMHFEVNDGIASTGQGIALKTAEFTLLGGGEVDLANENLRLAVSAKARKGLGVNANTIAKVIEVGGKIRSPGIQPSASGLFQTGVAIGAAIVSGGLSLIAQGLFDRIKANSDVCGIAANVVRVSEPVQ